MKLKRAGAVSVLLLASMFCAGCRDEPSAPEPPATPTDLTTATTPDPNEPGEEYWTPERMESALPEDMPTED